MKRYFILLTMLVGAVSLARADYRTNKTKQEIADKLSDYSYKAIAGSRTVTTDQRLLDNATFYGYATQFSMKVSSDSANPVSFWLTCSTYNTVQTATMTLRAGESFQDWFYVPVDSPTTINYVKPLPLGTTWNFQLGGLKKDSEREAQ